MPHVCTLKLQDNFYTKGDGDVHAEGYGDCYCDGDGNGDGDGDGNGKSWLLSFGIICDMGVEIPARSRQSKTNLMALVTKYVILITLKY